MATRKIRMNWYVDFWVGRERIRKKSLVNTRKGAEEYERQLRQSILTNPESTMKKEVTLKEFSKEFLQNYARVYNKPSEVDSKETILRVHLIPAMGKLYLHEIDQKIIDAYKASKLQQRPNPNTINHHLACLSKLLRTAEEWGYSVRLPKIRKLKIPPQKFDFLDFDEAGRLINAAYDTESRAMILCALHAGLRKGELIALAWEDVDFTARKINIRHSDYNGSWTPPRVAYYVLSL